MASPRSLVSVIIPTRDRPDLLRKALESVHRQTYQPVEVLVVDENDPQSDGQRATMTVVKEYESRLDIEFLTNRNPTWVCRARNEAAQRSRGEFLAFLDDDDWWRPEKVRRQIDVFDSSELHPVLVYTGLHVVDGQGNTIKRRVPRARGSIRNDLLVENVIGTPSSVMIRRLLFDEIGGFDESLPTRHDLDLYLRVSQLGTIDFVPEPVTVYLNQNPNAMSKHFTNKMEGRRMVFDKSRSLYDRDPRLSAAYEYGTGLLCMKHRQYAAAAHSFRRSLRMRFSVRSLVRYSLARIGEYGNRKSAGRNGDTQ